MPEPVLIQPVEKPVICKPHYDPSRYGQCRYSRNDWFYRGG